MDGDSIDKHTEFTVEPASETTGVNYRHRESAYTECTERTVRINEPLKIVEHCETRTRGFETPEPSSPVHEHHEHHESPAVLKRKGFSSTPENCLTPLNWDRARAKAQSFIIAKLDKCQKSSCSHYSQYQNSFVDFAATLIQAKWKTIL